MNLKTDKIKIISKKKNITMLAVYDYSFAKIAEKAGIDMLLVGDSLANVVLGLKSTKKVTFKEMLNHTKAVKKGAGNSLVIADMPYCTYQKNYKKSAYYAKKFINLAGADAVKIEWFSHFPETMDILRKNRIPVMAHIGLTPQTADKLGGFKVQGKDAQSARNLIKQAQLAQKLGAFSIVLECIPQEISKIITQKLSIPTIGIGSGKYCRGQVLVLYDILGIYQDFRPRFARRYLNLYNLSLEALKKFKQDIARGNFPKKEETFSINKEELKKIKKYV